MAAPAAPILHVTSQRLGTGASASVHIAQLSGHLVAAKLSGPRESARRQCRREARRYARFRNHRGITRFLGVAENAGTVVLVTELMVGGSLFDVLAARNGRALPLSTALRLALDVSDALAYIHRAGYSCGDVKSLNVLLTAALDPAGALRPGACAKLCDFGLSRRLNAATADDPHVLPDRRAPDFMFQSTVDQDPNAIAGTFAYLAPEAFEAPPRTAAGMVAADVYALAVVLWEIATVSIPWHGRSLGELMRAVRENRRLPWPPHARQLVGTEYIDLVERCWNRDPALRPPAAEVVAKLHAMYDGLVPPGTATIPDALLSCSDVSDYSGRDARDDADSVRSLVSSVESCAITEIESDDEEGDLDNDSFDIPISLFPYNPHSFERKEAAEAQEDGEQGMHKSPSRDDRTTEQESSDAATISAVDKPVVTTIPQSTSHSELDSEEDENVPPPYPEFSNYDIVDYYVQSSNALDVPAECRDSLDYAPGQRPGTPYPGIPRREVMASTVRRASDAAEAAHERKMREMREAEMQKQQLAIRKEQEMEQHRVEQQKQQLAIQKEKELEQRRVEQQRQQQAIEKEKEMEQRRVEQQKQQLAIQKEKELEQRRVEQQRQQQAIEKEKELEQHRVEQLRQQQAIEREREIEQRRVAQQQQQELQWQKGMHERQQQNSYMQQWQRMSRPPRPPQAKPRQMSYKVPPLTPALEWELRVMELADITPSLLWSVMQYA